LLWHLMLRVSETTGADIEDLGLERGHRTLTITRKGGKILTIPLALRTAAPLTWPSATVQTGQCS
jgi:integrase/recombinase XerD